MAGDRDYMAPFLHQAFDSFASLADRLAAINVAIAPESFQQVFDQGTQLFVNSHLLTHKEGKWQVGSLDLVESDEASYQRLLGSVAQAAASEETDSLHFLS